MLKRLFLLPILLFAFPGASSAQALCSTQTFAGPPGTVAWCQTSTNAPGTYTNLANGWTDDFTYTGSPAFLGNNPNQDSGYITFESTGGSPTQTQQFRANGLWFSDIASGGFGGTLVSPDHGGFNYQNGHLVAEVDNVVYPDGGSMWTEIVLSTVGSPTTPQQGLYARDQFGGHDTFGCLFKHDLNYHSVVACSLIGTGSYGPGTEANYICKSDNNGSACGNQPIALFDDLSFKVCVAQPSLTQVTGCLNRFKLDLTPTGWTVSVNGTTWLQDSFNLPSDLAGVSPVFVYFGSWTYFPNGVIRHTWKHLGVNSSSPAPSPTPTPTPVPTPIQINSLPCTVTFPSGPQTGTCSGTFQPK